MNVAGRWKKVTADSRCRSTTILTLHEDGSYHYDVSLEVPSLTTINRFGGAHVGTYSICGTEIEMSGDGRWTPGTQRLTEYRQMDPVQQT